MYGYFQNISILTNNLFNTTNYYYCQIISGFENGFNNENQIEVLNNINEYLTFKDKGNFNKDKKSFLNYNLLDGEFKCFKNKDYYVLPTHVNQQMMKEVNEVYKSFFKVSNKYYSNL